MRELDTQLTAWLRAQRPADVNPPCTVIEWNRFVTEAHQAGMAGLLLEHVSRYDLPLPSRVSSGLHRGAMAIAALNMNLTEELERVLGAFNCASVPVMLLKGAALNLTVYPRPDLRPMSDIDLLIRPKHVEETLRLLANHGCRRGFDLVRDGFFPRYHYEVELITGSPSPVRIDLHARPLRPLRVARTMPDDAFWEAAQTIHVGQSTAVIPRPEVMFIHLTAHAAYHGCSRLLWLYDIKRLTEHYGKSMDWSLVVQRLEDWRLSLPVRRAMERTTELFGPVCPPEVMNELGGHRVSWRDRIALAHAPRDAASPITHVAVDLLCTPGIRFRIGYLLAFLFPGRAHLGDVYPYRHLGWMLCAHAWRVFRTLGRMASVPCRGLVRVAHRMRSDSRPAVRIGL